MDKWYCRDPISSTVAASQIVFNINNCVDQSRVIQSRPSRPPDSKGRECYVYVLDGSSVRNIRDLPIDDLAPWNSKMCKSSTRFNAVTVNPQRGDMSMRRYIVSDTDNVPECLLACYYCKHPTFKLAKKIFYACDGRREACLPGSYVVFIYEFEGVETLYQRTYQNGSANRQPSGPRRHLTAAAAVTLGGSPQVPLSGAGTPRAALNGASPKRPYGQLSGIQDDIAQTQNALEAVMKATNNNTILTNNNDNNNGGNGRLEDMLGQLFRNDIKFDDLFQYSQLFENLNNNNNNDNKALAALPRVPTTPVGAGSLNSVSASGAKRRKVSNSVRINYSPVLGTPAQTRPKVDTTDPADFRMVYASDAMLDNFRRNGLCDAEKFASFCDTFADGSDNVTTASARELGGCLLLEPTFPCGRYFFTVLWFRNPTFLLDGQPAVQPLAILVAGRKQPDDYKCLLNDVQSKVQDSGKIIRSILAPESLGLEEFSAPGALFSYPCVRLNCLRDLQRTFPDEDLSDVTAKLFGADMSDGLLNTLRFEDFVCRLGQLDKKWPAGFRTWFREKSGWIFERLSYGSRLKAGFTSAEHVTMEDLLANAHENFTRRFEAFIESAALEFGLFSAVNALDEITNEIFVACAQAIFDEDSVESEQSASSSSAGDTHVKTAVEEEEEENVSNSSTVGPSSSSAGQSGSPVATPRHVASLLTLHPSLRSTCCMTRLQWRKCDSEKRQEILTELGLPTVLPCEICLDAKNGINPELLKALNRQERIEILSKAFELDVDQMDLSRFAGQNLQNQQSNSDEEHRFIVFDNAEKSFYYVSGNHTKNMTYCQCQKQKIANFSTAVIKTLICEHLCAVALVDERFVRTLNASFLAPPQLSNGAAASASGEIFENDADDTVMVGGEPMDSSSVSSAPSKPQLPFDIKLEGSTGVEIIRCAAQSPNSEGNERDSTKSITKPVVRSNGGSVHSIIDSLHNRSALRNQTKATEIPPAFDGNSEALENVIAVAQKIMGVKGFPSMKLEGDSLY